jgi:phosphatidylserine/phosphatidylglycerophosphate/cardiolipin synthase-like enzyme
MTIKLKDRLMTLRNAARDENSDLHKALVKLQTTMDTKESRRVITIVFVLVVGMIFAASWNAKIRTQNEQSQQSTSSTDNAGALSVPKQQTSTDQNIYSNEENLEAAEIATLRTAQNSMDIAMSDFTDTNIADTLAERARRGVRVRVYGNAGPTRAASSAQVLAILHNAGVPVRLRKGAIMGLSSYQIDGKVLRTGAAMWTAQSLLYSDSDLHVQSTPGATDAFRSNFEKMWERGSNIIINPAPHL